VPVVGGPPYNQFFEEAKIPVPTMADRLMFYKAPPFDYMPTTLAERQLYMSIMTVMKSDLQNDPSRRMYEISSEFESASIAASDAIAKGNTIAYTNAFQGIVSGLGSGGGGGGGGGIGAAGGSGAGALINIANEASGVPTTGSAPQKIIPQAVWMVQQMYKYVFTPLAILFLLPGAVITQVKAQVSANMNLRADDASSPFEGILRSIVALFLIPCTQLIVSYSIDVGNSMAYEVSNWVDLNSILEWANKLSYNPANYDNMVLPPQPASSSSGGGGSSGASAASAGGTNWAGLAASGNWSALTQAALGALGGNQGSGNQQAGDGEEPNEDENQAVNERQAWDSTSLQTLFNSTMDIFSLALMVLTAFQLVYMCYLYLMGPLSAAFFAWPTVQGKLFRTVFGNWMNAVIMLALWRFYWMVILAIMTQRLIYVGETGGQFDLQWEVAVFTCLLGLMFYVPMNPWNFDPGNAYQVSTQLGQGLMNGGGGGGDGGGGGGGDGGMESAAAPGQDAQHHQPDQQHGSQRDRSSRPQHGPDPSNNLVMADAADQEGDGEEYDDSSTEQPGQGSPERTGSGGRTALAMAPPPECPDEEEQAEEGDSGDQTNQNKGRLVASTGFNPNSAMDDDEDDSGTDENAQDGVGPPPSSKGSSGPKGTLMAGLTQPDSEDDSANAGTSDDFDMPRSAPVNSRSVAMSPPPTSGGTGDFNNGSQEEGTV
jgi:uncharacterized membrane protein YgcG